MQASPEAQRLPLPASLLRDEWWRSRFLVGGYAVLLHALASVYYVALAGLYRYIQADPSLTMLIDSLEGDILNYVNAVVVAAVLLAVAHGLAICFSCHRALSPRCKRRVHAVADSDVGLRSQHVKRTASRWSRQNCRKSTLAALTQWDHRLDSLCGGGSYELLVLFEVGLQVFQAFKLSRLVATLWINRMMVLVIVTNCWFIPIVSVVFRKKMPSFIKIVHLALDSALEIVYGMVIPLAIFYPYYRDMNHILNDNPFVNYYMDTWYINALAENRQIYVTSWIDFVSKMAPGIGLFLRLVALQARRAEYEIWVKIGSASEIPATQDEHSSRHRNKKRVVNSALFLVGLGVLVAHLAARATSVTGKDPGCLLEMTPLGSTQYSCAVLEVSCTQKCISGTKSELDDALRHVDPASLQGLIFSHCEALAMPPRVKTFPWLVDIKIHNCSIEEWGDDAALTAQAHPALQTLYLTMTNLSQIPDGLISLDFPPMLSDIEFCGTNLTGLPMDLTEKWSTVSTFVLERSPGITEFPPALYRTDTTIPVVSLASNAITALPVDLFIGGHAPSVLFLSGNPLLKLPEQVGAASAMHVLAIAFTGVAEMPPSWTTASGEPTRPGASLFMPAGSTPMCDTILEAQAQSPSSSGSATPAWLHAACSPHSLNKPFYFPLELVEQWRQVNRV